jgi:hypothetical protein
MIPTSFEEVLTGIDISNITKTSEETFELSTNFKLSHLLSSIDNKLKTEIPKEIQNLTIKKIIISRPKEFQMKHNILKYNLRVFSDEEASVNFTIPQKSKSNELKNFNLNFVFIYSGKDKVTSKKPEKKKFFDNFKTLLDSNGSTDALSSLEVDSRIYIYDSSFYTKAWICLNKTKLSVNLTFDSMNYIEFNLNRDSEEFQCLEFSEIFALWNIQLQDDVFIRNFSKRQLSEPFSYVIIKFNGIIVNDELKVKGISLDCKWKKDDNLIQPIHVDFNCSVVEDLNIKLLSGSEIHSIHQPNNSSSSIIYHTEKGGALNDEWFLFPDELMDFIPDDIFVYYTLEFLYNTKIDENLSIVWVDLVKIQTLHLTSKFSFEFRSKPSPTIFFHIYLKPGYVEVSLGKEENSWTFEYDLHHETENKLNQIELNDLLSEFSVPFQGKQNSIFHIHNVRVVSYFLVLEGILDENETEKAIFKIPFHEGEPVQFTFKSTNYSPFHLPLEISKMKNFTDLKFFHQ